MSLRSPRIGLRKHIDVIFLSIAEKEILTEKEIEGQGSVLLSSNEVHVHGNRCQHMHWHIALFELKGISSLREAKAFTSSGFFLLN